MAVSTDKQRVISPALQTPESLNAQGETPEKLPQTSAPIVGRNIKFELAGKDRPNRPSSTLQANLVRTAEQVYGPGSRVVVYSGQGQLGSFRHRDVGGLAADVYIQLPDGRGGYRTATPTETSLMGQAWLAQGLGSVGFGMNTPSYQQGIHLDLWTADRRQQAGYGGGSLWAYYEGNDVSFSTAVANGWISPEIAANLKSGERGGVPSGTTLTGGGDVSSSLAQEARDRPVEPDKAYAHYSEPPGGDDGTAYGTFSTPDIGAKVWVFFLGGDPQKPVYFAQVLDPSSMQQANSYGAPTTDEAAGVGIPSNEIVSPLPPAPEQQNPAPNVQNQPPAGGTPVGGLPGQLSTGTGGNNSTST